MSTALRLLASEAPSDEEGIKRLARIDREAASEAVVRRWQTPLVHHASWIVKDPEEAVDVAQEVLVRALREPKFFDPGFQMKAWLYRVTTNLCFNRVRDRRRRAAILAAEPFARAEEPHQSGNVLRAERATRIRRALDRLSENHRRILELRYWGDLSYGEIGDTLGIKLGTVMSRLSRARAQLAEHLDEDEREAC
jgi:RNA polymerase sigma-70 factor (ECF subfamily)